ncbi:MAG: hypothetical protein ACUVX1_15210 [Chloroflexota bacterium]
MRNAHIVLDADVVIDYCSTDIGILRLARSVAAGINVVSTTLAEIPSLDENACSYNGIAVVEPTLEELLLAVGRRGRLSTPDHLCLLVAKRRGWTCVANDNAPRGECVKEGVPTMWGLEIMVELVESGLLSPSRAIGIAEQIIRNNLYITGEIVQRFRKRLVGR